MKLKGIKEEINPLTAGPVMTHEEKTVFPLLGLKTSEPIHEVVKKLNSDLNKMLRGSK